ncbi:DUF4352 domain-containing protein [Rhodococcus cerastii]|nr:DUF4352 domain-containing protein [Rhodococcus cerastii]
MKRMTTAITALAVLALAGCSSEPNDPTDTHDSTTSAETSPAASDGEIAMPNEKHVPRSERAESDGTAITISSVDTVREIPFQQESDPALYETKVAEEGQKFIIVSTTVENIGSQGIDVSCGNSIANALLDTDERPFEPIEPLSRMEGNRACKDLLEPGSSAVMHYVYEVPENVTPASFGFYDTETPTGAPQVRYIDF